MYGFANIDDIQRIADATRIVETMVRTEDRGIRGKIAAAFNLALAIGKTDAAINKSTLASPATGVVSVWAGGADFASMADTGDNINAYTFFGNVASGKVVLCVLLPMGWVIFCAECA